MLNCLPHSEGGGDVRGWWFPNECSRTRNSSTRLQLPIIIVVWVDSDLGVISTKQRLEFGRSVFTNFNNPDFVKLAESFGAKGYRVTSTCEFSSVLREAIKSIHTPVVIAIDIDADRNELLFKHDRFSE